MKKIITSFYIAALVMNILAAYTAPSAVFAQTQSATTCASNSTGICNPLNSSSVTDLLTNLVNVAIPVGAVIAVIMYIYVGFLFIFAQGKQEEITKAWKWFAYVSIGTAILIGAKVIVAIMESTLTSAGLVQSGLLPTSSQ